MNKLPTRKRLRADFHDYNGGEYFITVCVANHKHLLGEILNGRMHMSTCGEILRQTLDSISSRCQGVTIPIYTVMPNHFHAIIHIEGHDNCGSDTADHRGCILGRVVTAIKANVTRQTRRAGMQFGWQRKYNDHIIRGIHDRNNISRYIENNVANWNTDEFFG